MSPNCSNIPDDLQSPKDENGVVCGIGKNVAVVGNRIQLNETTLEDSVVATETGHFGRGYKHSGILSISLDDVRS